MSAPSESKLIRCASCGTTNRVPLEKLRGHAQPICGKCKNLLELSVHPITVTDANFATEVEQSPLPVLLDMWAAWCGPCRMIAPVIEQLATELDGRVRVGKLNVDENKKVAARFRVQSIPTLLILKNGQEIDRIVGAMPKQEILRRLQTHI